MTTGGCLCGAVRFEIDGTIGPITCCHCAQCRRASGSAFTTAASVYAECFRVVQGTERLREHASSPRNTRVFCSQCGSQLFSRHEDHPMIVRVRAGAFDADPKSHVAADIMMSSKADWLENHEHAEEFPELPPLSYFLPDATLTRVMPRSPRPNVTLVQRAYEAFFRRDIRAVLHLLHPDVEIRQASEIPWGGTYTGHAEAAAFFGKLVSTITSAVTLESFIDADDRVVALGRTRGKVNATGKSFDVPIAHVWTIQDGLVTRVEYYIDDPTMLAALV
jgi:ketosteroid isomerase-like protein